MADAPTEPLVIRLVRKIAPQLGLEIDVSTELKFFARISNQNGLVGYIRGSRFPLNSGSSTELVNSKAASAYFLAKLGYPIIKGAWFGLQGARSEESMAVCADQAFSYAETLGFPVYIKPNSLSQGFGVTKVFGRDDFYTAARIILEQDTDLLVQEVATGKDYRIIVLDNQVMCAYLRTPLTVVGDGVASISKLLERRREEVKVRGAVVNHADTRIVAMLNRLRLTLDSVPESGQVLQLLDNANLSSGGEATDVSAEIHPHLKEVAISLVKDMGLRFCGVDLMIDLNIAEETASYKVIELNAAPGLDNFAALGDKQLQLVEELYLQILRKMIEASH